MSHLPTTSTIAHACGLLALSLGAVALTTGHPALLGTGLVFLVVAVGAGARCGRTATSARVEIEGVDQG